MYKFGTRGIPSCHRWLRKNLEDISGGTPINGKVSMVFQNLGFTNSDARNPDERNASFTGFFRSMSLKNW